MWYLIWCSVCLLYGHLPSGDTVATGLRIMLLKPSIWTIHLHGQPTKQQNMSTLLFPSTNHEHPSFPVCPNSQMHYPPCCPSSNSFRNLSYPECLSEISNNLSYSLPFSFNSCPTKGQMARLIHIHTV